MIVPKLPSSSSLEEISQEKSKLISLFTDISNSPQAFTDKDVKLSLLELRRFNRHLAFTILEQKRKLAALKSVIDELNCKYFSQKYEKEHLIDEIRSCLNSKHIYPTALESLDLSINHEEMIKTLHNELAGRKDLQAKLLSVLQRKQASESELEGKKEKLETLKGSLQNLLKNSKSLIDACGYDLDALQQQRRMDTGSQVASFERLDTEVLQQIHEKLVGLVAAAKPEDYKLRFFEAIDESKGEDDVEGEDGGMSLRLLDNFKSAYIQIKMEAESVDIFLTLQKGHLYLSIRDEASSNYSYLPDAMNWIKGLQLIETIQNINEEDPFSSQSAWIAPTILQPPEDDSTKAFDELFDSIRAAIRLRNRLANLFAEDRFAGLVDFDKNNVAELVAPSIDLHARIALDSIIWRKGSVEREEGGGDYSDDNFIDNLNEIGAKYRSVLDCLEAQIDLIRAFRIDQ